MEKICIIYLANHGEKEKMMDELEADALYDLRKMNTIEYAKKLVEINQRIREIVIADKKIPFGLLDEREALERLLDEAYADFPGWYGSEEQCLERKVRRAVERESWDLYLSLREERDRSWFSRLLTKIA